MSNTDVSAILMRLDSINVRLSEIDERLDRIDARLDRIETRIAVLFETLPVDDPYGEIP